MIISSTSIEYISPMQKIFHNGRIVLNNFFCPLFALSAYSGCTRITPKRVSLSGIAVESHEKG